MNRYGEKSSQVFSELCAELQFIFAKVLEIRDHSLTCGFRPEDIQNAAFESGNSQVEWPDGKHNTIPSDAVDAHPYPLPISWGELKDKAVREVLKDNPELVGKVIQEFYYFGFLVVGVAHGMGFQIRWGGDWDGDMDVNDQKFNDLLHFEIVRGK